MACPGGTGTLSEIALALKNGRTVIIMNFDVGEIFAPYEKKGQLHYAKTPEDVIEKIMVNYEL